MFEAEDNKQADEHVEKMRGRGGFGNRGFFPGRGRGFGPPRPQGFQPGGPPPPGGPWGFNQRFPLEQHHSQNGPCFAGPPGPGSHGHTQDTNRVSPPFGHAFSGRVGPPQMRPPVGPHANRFPPPFDHAFSGHGPGFAGPPPMIPTMSMGHTSMDTPGPGGPFQGHVARGPHFSDFNSSHHGQKRSWNDKGQRGQGPKKKQKIDKRDLPENNKFVCESCDKGYATEDKFKEHVTTHVKCKVEGCSYVAAAKLVDLHYQWQHRTGLAKKIWQLESKEDIEKWKQERRKHYPTPENVAKKKAVLEEKKARGEVIENKYFGKMKGRGRGRDRGRGRGRGRFTEHQPQREDTCSSDSKDDSESNKTPVPENPLDILITGTTTELSDEEKPEIKEESKNEAPTDSSSISGGLGLLMTTYDSDESLEEGEIKDTPEISAVKAANENNEEKEKTEAVDNQVGPSLPKENVQEEDRHRRKNRNRKRNNKHIAKQYRHPHNQPYSKPTLLEQLLAGEIRRERNTIMQCVRHIVKTDFLGIGCRVEGFMKKSDQSESSHEKSPGETSSVCDVQGQDGNDKDSNIPMKEPVHKVFNSDDSSSDSEDSGVKAW